jgi:hypothetical protein
VPVQGHCRSSSSCAVRRCDMKRREECKLYYVSVEL